MKRVSPATALVGIAVAVAVSFAVMSLWNEPKDPGPQVPHKSPATDPQESPPLALVTVPIPEVKLSSDAQFIRGQLIKGQIVDASGVGIRDAEVKPFPYLKTEHVIVRSRDDGTFTLPRRSKSLKPVRLRVAKAGYVVAFVPSPFSWGTTDVRIQLEREAGCEIRVVNAATGEPIEAYSVRCYPEASRFDDKSYHLRHSGHHANGILHINKLAKGAHLLEVIPADQARFAPSLPLAITITNEVSAQREIRLQADETLQVQVTTTNGAPLQGAWVTLLEQRGDSVVTNESAYAILRAAGSFVQSKSTRQKAMPGLKRSAIVPSKKARPQLQNGLVAIDTQQTDDSGFVELKATPLRSYGLYVHGVNFGDDLSKAHRNARRYSTIMHEAKAVADLALDGSTVTVRVDALASIRVTTQPSLMPSPRTRPAPGESLVLPPREARLRLIKLNDSKWTWPPIEEKGMSLLHLNINKGTLHAVRLHDWRLQIELDYGTAKGKSLRVVERLGTVLALRGGETRQVELNFAELMPARISLKTKIDGELQLDGLSFRLIGQREASKHLASQKFPRVECKLTQQQGRKRTRQGSLYLSLPGGRWTIMVSRDGEQYHTARTDLALKPGQMNPVTLELRSQDLK